MSTEKGEQGERVIRPYRTGYRLREREAEGGAAADVRLRV
jgi:hypothetical protein